MKAMYYILNEKNEVVGVDDVLTWGFFFENTKRRILKQEFVGRYWVSTVFLGLDHRFDEDGPPLIFETMVFHRGWLDGYGYKIGKEGRWSEREIDRYSTWEEAMNGHRAMVEQFKRKEGILRCLLSTSRLLHGSKVTFIKIKSYIQDEINGLKILKKYKKILTKS